MASRKEEKERLRAERRADEAQSDVEERRRRLIQYGSAAVLTAIVAVVILVVASQSGSDKPPDPSRITDADLVSKQLDGIPQKGTVLGEPGAKATIVEFGDLQCPVCKAFSEQVSPDLIEGPVRSGDAKYDFRQWTIIGPDSKTAAAAALAAGEQGRYWNFVELFYRNQGTENGGYVDDDFLEAIAKGAGVPDIDQWNEDREESKWSARLEAIDAQATGLGFSGTPSVMVEGPGGRKVFTDAIPSAEEIEAAIVQVS